MGEMGKVIGVKDDLVVVSIKAHKACEGCKVCKKGEDGDMQATVKNVCGAAIGDFVEVSLKDGALSRAVFLAYGMPLVFMLLGFFVGYMLLGELFAFALGIVAIGISYGIIKLLDNKKRRDFMPTAVRKVSEDMMNEFAALMSLNDDENE